MGSGEREREKEREKRDRAVVEQVFLSWGRFLNLSLSPAESRTDEDVLHINDSCSVTPDLFSVYVRFPPLSIISEVFLHVSTSIKNISVHHFGQEVWFRTCSIHILLIYRSILLFWVTSSEGLHALMLKKHVSFLNHSLSSCLFKAMTPLPWLVSSQTPEPALLTVPPVSSVGFQLQISFTVIVI